MILGISFDEVAANAAFAAKFQFPFRLLCDTDKAVASAYEAIETAGDDVGWPKRVSFLIERDGTIGRHYQPVDVRTHAATVLADLHAR